jgi:hypothetical protein
MAHRIAYVKLLALSVAAFRDEIVALSMEREEYAGVVPEDHWGLLD